MMLNSSFLPCFEGERAHSSNFKSDILDVRAGHCPECRLQFRKPVALPCGHSLCQPCCDQLLTRCNGNSVMSRRNSRRQSVLMGLSAIERRNRQKPKLSKTLSVINECDDEPTKKTVYSSPNCPVCLARPSFKQPVPNIALEKLLFAWDRNQKDAKSESILDVLQWI
uniref:RING-type domain-containing protein n=1 Tax=Panagrolaimus sp. JU765 TaxID=591449 RepID=A0AC34R196_9BILA